ncbi:MAG: thioredoxin family protein [Planctomycetes bacterium]|nr:thioredoxin family protein [Planctomycetota bacterium]
MPYKRFAALAIFMISTAVYFACNPDSSAKNDKPAESTQDSGQPGAINWRKEWSAAKSEAASSGKLVMIDFYTTWCAPCKMLEKKAFPDARVVKAASQLVAIRQTPSVKVNRSPRNTAYEPIRRCFCRWRRKRKGAYRGLLRPRKSQRRRFRK